MHGVYRQRSYDNLQNGKSPFNRSSVKSLHLPPTYANQTSHQLNKKFSLSIQKFGPVGVHRDYTPSAQNHPGQAIPSNFKYVSPQSKYQPNVDFDSNSLPRYPYHKNRAVLSGSYQPHYDGVCKEYYRQNQVRHPTTPPPPPPVFHKNTEEQNLLPTPTSSTSSADTYSSEWDPMIASGSSVKRIGLDHMAQYRTCKRQIQQATQLFNPHPQHQTYFDNYFHQYNQQSPYRKYLNAVQNHQLQLSPNIHVYHNPAKRLSNVYEYQFTNFDINSTNENPRNES